MQLAGRVHGRPGTSRTHFQVNHVLLSCRMNSKAANVVQALVCGDIVCSVRANYGKE